MGKKAGNRKHSKIDALDPALRETVEQMLLSGSTYSEIVDFLGANGVGISVASVCRYARAYQAEVQMLNMAQENFRRMMDELDKYRDIDIQFRRNKPQNVLEIAQIITMLSGELSRETRLQMLPTIDNVQDELQKLEDEKQQEVNSFGQYNALAQALAQAKAQPEGAEASPEDEPEEKAGEGA